MWWKNIPLPRRPWKRCTTKTPGGGDERPNRSGTPSRRVSQKHTTAQLPTSADVVAVLPGTAWGCFAASSPPVAWRSHAGESRGLAQWWRALAWERRCVPLLRSPGAIGAAGLPERQFPRHLGLGLVANGSQSHCFKLELPGRVPAFPAFHETALLMQCARLEPSTKRG